MKTWILTPCTTPLRVRRTEATGDPTLARGDDSRAAVESLGGVAVRVLDGWRLVASEEVVGHFLVRELDPIRDAEIVKRDADRRSALNAAMADQ